MTKIDQIMVRNVGGWNLISEDDWQQIPAKERLKLVSSKSVQFFGDGVPVDTMEALKSLAKLDGWVPTEKSTPVESGRAEKVEPDSQAKSNEAVELAAAKLSSANYTRLVIAGPSWQVQRSKPEMEPVPFYEVRNRASDDLYDLDNPSGVSLFISDLIADAYGIADPIDAILPTEAVDYFDATYFSADLGDRFWQVSANEIRSQVESNPHIKMLSRSDT